MRDYKIGTGGSDPITYSKSSNGYDRSSDTPIGKARLPGVRLWGHRINIQGDHTIKCEECGIEKEFPRLLEMTTEYRQVLYKMFVLGTFKQEMCRPEYETDNSILNTNDTINNTYTTNGNDVNTEVAKRVPTGDKISLDGTVWEHKSGGVWDAVDAKLPAVTSDALSHKYGKEFLDKTLPSSRNKTTL